MAGYYNPTPYTPYGNTGIGNSGAYGYQGVAYPGNPYNYTQGQNIAAIQPQIGAQQPQVQQQNNGSPFIMVPSREAAKDITVSANQTIYAMSQNAPEFYVKSADNMGLVTTRYFKFAEFDPAVEAAQLQAQAQAAQNAQNNAPAGDYVPRSEFNQVVQVVNNLSQELNSVRQSIANAPQNAIVNEPAPVPVVPKSTSKKTKESNND